MSTSTPTSRRFDRGMPVCSNCEQWQHPRTETHWDCVNDCAERGFANGTMTCEDYAAMHAQRDEKMPRHLRHESLTKSAPFTGDFEKTQRMVRCDTCGRWRDPQEHAECPRAARPESTPQHEALVAVLVREDRRMERQELRHGQRVNIHRIAHFLRALGDAEAHPRGLRAGIEDHFCGGLQAKLLKAVTS